MPLSERAKSESSKPNMTNGLSDPSYMPDELVELQWDNGQIVMQGQTHRVRKNTFSVAEGQVMESRGRSLHKFGHYSGMESPSANEPHIELHAQVDDMVPWINYPIEDPLQNDCCSEFLNEFSTSTFNSLAVQNKFIPSLSSSTAQVVSSSHHLEKLESSKFVTENSVKKGIRTSQPLQLAHESLFSIPSANSRVTYVCSGSAIKAHQGPNGSSKTSRLQKPEMGGLCTSGMNFSHFSRAVTLAKARLQCNDRLASKEKASTSNPLVSTLTESSNGFKKTIVSQGQLDVIPMREEQRLTAKPIKEAICREDASRKNNATDVCDRVPDQIQNESFAASTAYEKKENEKVRLPVESTSVCSGSSTGEASNDPKPAGKRKHCEGEESGYLSEDVEDESVGVKKAAADRGPVPKRSRAAEVHNLSERRRRDRINERMRALQQLIPNCNKADKASMLDEAIEYLKSLQLQVQMMSMSSSMFVPPIMLPPGMQQLPAPSMANFYTLGMGMRMSNGMGMYDTKGIPSFPNMPFPNMHGPQFPCSSIPGMAGLHGMAGTAGLQMFGISGHGFPMAMMPSQPLFGPSGLAKMENVLHASHADPSSGSSDKLQQTLNLNTMQKRSPPDLQEVKARLTTAEDRQLDPH